MNLAPNDPRHGTVNGYGNLGCRCDQCRSAKAASQRRYMNAHPEQREKHRKATRARYVSHPRPLPSCGSIGALRRHRRAGERCDICLEADNERRRTKTGARKRVPAAHGTASGAKAHYRRKEPLCEPCRLAWNEWCKYLKRLQQLRQDAA